MSSAGHPVESVEIFGEGPPVPTNPLVESRARNVFHAFHQLDQALLIVRADGCETDATISDDGRRHSVPARRSQVGIPGGLPVVVGVDVDEPRSDQEPISVENPPSGSVDTADVDDHTVSDSDVR